MSDQKDCIITEDIEFLEYAVRDLEAASKMYEDMDFTCVGWRSEGSRKSKLYQQGDARFVLSASSVESDAAYQFTRKHGDGCLTLAMRVPDSKVAYDQALKRGAESAYDLTQNENSKGTMKQSAIKVYGSVENAFVSYSGSDRLADYFPENKAPASDHYLQLIDHVTVNLRKGEMDKWADFYVDLFGFEQVRFFDIRTGKTGLLSRAMRNPNGKITMPFNEPTDAKSQIQEFIDTYNGPGVQHVALLTKDIIPNLRDLHRKKFEFLTVPGTYYEEVPKRVPNVSENMKDLQDLGILVDGDEKGYLLQIFTQPMVGPFFFEFIQRKGNDGFGEGNFRALFEAIERDQERRGVL